MNKTEIVNDLAERLSLKTECYRFCASLANIDDRAPVQSDSLILQGFGTFHPWSQTAAREGRYPRTGETCLIRPRRSVKFKPGKMLLQS